MEKLKSIIKKINTILFSYKNNFVVFFFTFILLTGCLISSNLVLANTACYESVVDEFPNQLKVEYGRGMSYFNETNDNMYSTLKNFKVLSYYCEPGKTNYINQINTNKNRVIIYGVDNNFFSLPILIDSHQQFGFLNLEILKQQSFSVDSIVSNDTKAIILTNYDHAWEQSLSIGDKKFNIISIVGLNEAVKEKTTFIFIPITTFYSVFDKSENFIDWFIYSSGSNILPTKNRLITKADILELYNLKIDHANNYLNIMYLCLFIICFSNCIINIINTKNRNIEIGVKLAFGAKKRTIILEFLAEHFGVILLATILACFCSILIVLNIETFLTVLNGLNCFYINLTFSMFFISVYLLVSLLFTIVPAGILSNTNVETILKEER